MGNVVDVNSADLIKFSKKLDRISKKALPRTVRNTLNSLAFNTKKKTLIEESNKAFTNRAKNFFKAFSRVEMAKQKKINDMVSQVGMTPKGRGGRFVQAGENMLQQNVGGKIDHRSLVPIDTARVAEKNERRVRKENWLRNLDVVLDTKDARVTKAKQRFVRSAIYVVERFGSGGVIQHRRTDGRTMLYRVKRGGSDIITRQFDLKITPLYSVKPGRSVQINEPVPFVKRSAERSMKDAQKIFSKHAERQLRKTR